MTRRRRLDIVLTDQDILRFFSKVPIGGEGCWEWQGGRVKGRGYGMFWLGDSNRRASRVMWTILNGPIEGDLLVCHSCDNPPCVNPHHLFLGDNSDNMLDCNMKGLHSHWSSKKTHCKSGHEFTEENIYWEMTPNGTLTRKCRTCRRIKGLAWYYRNKEKDNA